MNPFRAKKIADYFANTGVFTIRRTLHGINVHFCNIQTYFEDESALWAFLFYIAHAHHYETIITEAESKLAI